MPRMDSSGGTPIAGGAGTGVTNGATYTWHLSLRLDRPVEGCTVRPHAYMYSKKIDERTNSEELNKLPPHSKRSVRPPPPHEFVYRWFRGPLVEICGNENCVRRTSFNPIDWTHYALQGGYETVRDKQNPCRNYGTPDATITSNILCPLQCVSGQSSLYKSTFCNAKCFVEAWRNQQHTIGNQYAPTNGNANSLSPTGSGAFQRLSSGESSGGLPDDISVASMGSAGSAPFQPSYMVNNPYQNGAKSPSQQHNSPTTPPHGSLTTISPINSANGAMIMNANDASLSMPQNDNDLAGNRSRTGSYVGGYSSNNPYADDLDVFGSGEEGWVEVSRDAYYVPTEMDMGRKLSLEATSISHTGKTLMQRVVKTDLVLSRPPDPIKRNLITAQNIGKSSNVGARFRLVTYNVLSEIYATQQQYPYCDFWALSSEYRFHNILREVLDVNPDVVCLQEVQADHYENFVYNAFSDAGYEGVYKAKTRASMGMVGKVDGCALFWRRSKFHIIESYSIEMNELAQRHANHVGVNTRTEEGMAFLNRLSKDNVAQLVVLELAFPTLPTRSNREPINQICIANTHLYSNKDFPDVKLWQTWQLLQELENFIFSKATNLPLIICGDFNSTPDTAVYNLLLHQSVHPGHPDVNLPNDDANVLPDPMSITHSFQLGSSYATVVGEEPPFTNYTTNFKGTLDYIWYSANNLRPLAVAEIPSEDDILHFGEGMPSAQYSSDHIMMVADMQILLRPP